MVIMVIKNHYKMVGSFKILFFFIFIFSCSKKQDSNVNVAKSIIDQNFKILVDPGSYFELNNISKNIKDSKKINLNNAVIGIKSQESEKMFKTKFKLEDDKLNLIYFTIKKIPANTINQHSLILTSSDLRDSSFINVNFANFFIDKSLKYSSITVIKSSGMGVKFEIYYFRKIRSQWIYQGKELLALG